MTVEGQKAEATLEECGFDYADVKANVKAAMDYGKSGGLFGRYKSLRKLSKEKVVRKRRRIFWKNGQFHLQSTHRMRPLRKVEADFRLTKRKLERP